MRSSRLMKSNLTSATCGTEDSRGLSGRREVAPVNPGHRPSASALGYALPARWAGFVRRSYLVAARAVNAFPANIPLPKAERASVEPSRSLPKLENRFRSFPAAFVSSRACFCDPNAHFASPTLFELPERLLFFARRFLRVPSPRLSSGTGVLASGASSFFPSRFLGVQGRRDSFGAAVRLPEGASFFPRRPKPPSRSRLARGCSLTTDSPAGGNGCGPFPPAFPFAAPAG